MAARVALALALALACLAVGGHASPAERAQVHALLLGAKAQPRQAFWAWAKQHDKPYARAEALALSASSSSTSSSASTNGEGAAPPQTTDALALEAERRFRAWFDNLEYVLAYNANGTGSHWLSMNALADLTHEEYKRKYGLSRERFAAARARRAAAAAQTNAPAPFRHGGVDPSRMPLSVDWRATKAVAEVKNQLNCGSCWAFSTTGAVEGVNAIFSGELVSLSEQELVDCDTSQDKGCSGGLMDFAFQFILDNGGIDAEDDYPYKAEDGQCQERRRRRRVVSIDGFEDVPAGDEVALKKAVSRQPVSVAIEADQRSFQLYGGGVYDSEDCGEQLDHGVLAVGYGTDATPVPPQPPGGQGEGSGGGGGGGGGGDAPSSSDADDASSDPSAGLPGPLPRHNYWIVKNSWGPGWGEAGFIRLRMGAGGKKGLCGVASVPSYPPGPPPPDPFAPVACDAGHACPPLSTCCCVGGEDANECGGWGCCPMPDATCCGDGEHCCPSDLPVCDTDQGRCLPKPSSAFGGAAAAAFGGGAAAPRRSVPWATKTPAHALRAGLALPGALARGQRPLTT